jgi:hypothetical protein
VGADQVAAIRPLIVELAEAPSASPGAEFCARFTVPEQPGAWAEVVAGTVNFAYPFTDDPIARLGRLGLALPGLGVREWEPGLFATIGFGLSATPREVARFVDGLLAGLHGLADDYPIDTEIARV